VDNLNQAPQIGREIEQAARQGFHDHQLDGAESRACFALSMLEQIVTFIVIALIVIVAALNILIALTMIGDGENPRHCGHDELWGRTRAGRRIFLMEGLLISLVGTALGLALGYSLPGRAAITTLLHLSAEVLVN